MCFGDLSFCVRRPHAEGAIPRASPCGEDMPRFHYGIGQRTHPLGLFWARSEHDRGRGSLNFLSRRWGARRGHSPDGSMINYPTLDLGVPRLLGGIFLH